MTPICRTCDTKFPGKDVCKTCGADPNAEPTLDYKIERAKLAPIVLPKTSVDLSIIDEARRISNAVTKEMYASLASPKTNFAKRAKGALGSRDVARIFGVPTQLIVDRKSLKKERSARKARVRSLEATRTSGRKCKHGRVGVR